MSVEALKVGLSRFPPHGFSTTRPNLSLVPAAIPWADLTLKFNMYRTPASDWSLKKETRPRCLRQQKNLPIYTVTIYYSSSHAHLTRWTKRWTQYGSQASDISVIVSCSVTLLSLSVLWFHHHPHVLHCWHACVTFKTLSHRRRCRGGAELYRKTEWKQNETDVDAQQE